LEYDGHIPRQRRTSIILDGMIKGTSGRGSPRTCYVSQILKDARVTSYKQLKDKAQDGESWREQTNLPIE